MTVTNKTATEEIDSTERDIILSGLRDVVANDALLAEVQHEKVFANSLMRGVSFSVIQGQFKRVLNGLLALSDFHFSHHQEGDEKHAKVELDFRVGAASKPSTNVPVLIGRNGVHLRCLGPPYAIYDVVASNYNKMKNVFTRLPDERF
ncbi:hypothetical protein LSG25_12855 [Paralcaligenes sp. KSB-10]|uniref:hypothetical protein n=1 Tax=Paralcaligenes sp. KSB-10 TaxID=2901142 RepID=UPI001E6432DC|nr:hypothetical protein [Paralcaligenes sp. KSB-10]UHL62959.1 hypothetical protein LSG25_12855 [Paralcaligenes sp. KSB-10]